MDNPLMPLDTVAANVYDLPRVLEGLRRLTGLKPFLQFELVLSHGSVPVVLVMCGEETLEFLAHAQGSHPPGAARITRVLLEIPGREPAEVELEPGLCLAIRPGPKTRLVEIEIRSGAQEADVALFQSACGATQATRSEPGQGLLSIGDVCLRFLPPAGDTVVQQAQVPDQSLPGWHRVSLACTDVEDAVAALTKAGAAVEVPPYQVLPGLREAMVRSPSGLIIQPAKQQLWKMLPAFGFRALASKLTGNPVRVTAKPTM